MRKITTKSRCEKRFFTKCVGVCKTYSAIQTAYAFALEENSRILEFRANVILDGDLTNFSTDFVCATTDGKILVRECISKSMLQRKSSCKLLESSRKYWLSKDVVEWGIVIDGE